MQDVISRFLLMPLIGYEHIVVPALLTPAMQSGNRTSREKM